MSYYGDILDAANTALSGVSALSAYTIHLRPDPIYFRDGDTLPTLIVSPRRDIQEQVIDLQFSEDKTGKGLATIDFPVLVTFVFSNTKDQVAMHLEQAVRQAVWQALFVPLGAAYDVDYDPAPGGLTQGLTEAVDASRQEFRYRAVVPRSA